MIITNERQYKMTKAQIERLQNEIREVREQHVRQPLNRLMIKLQEDSHKRLMDGLTAQIREYEKLKSGRLTSLRATSFLDLPKLLIRARVVRGWTQKELAEALNLHEQKVQQYEADEYATASFRRLYEIADVLGIELISKARLKAWKAGVKGTREERSSKEPRVRAKHVSSHVSRAM